MGAKTWMLVGADSDPRELLAVKPLLDRAASLRLARQLFPKEDLEPLDDGDLSYTCPPDDELHIGSFVGISIVAAKEFGLDRPSKLDPRYLQVLGSKHIYLHAMHSVVDWFAFAVWQDGHLQRSLSLAPEDGVLEDIGARLPFELPFWAGERPVFGSEEDTDEQYPFPFHPLELGEAALSAFFGYQLEGYVDESQLAPENVPLARFKRRHSKFKFW